MRTRLRGTQSTVPVQPPGALERPAAVASRARIEGKVLVADGLVLPLKGVTYGPFRPNLAGEDIPGPAQALRDLRQIAAAGFNTIRVYTVPPRWLLDAAAHEGLRVLVGLPWEQHVAFLDEAGRRRSIEERVRAGVRDTLGHAAVLAYAVGNEIPASIVRWYGARRVERFLDRLVDAVRDEDPDALVTYVNYPTTEYLQLALLDLVCFNVYLEARGPYEAYLARLQALAGDRPLVLAELGLDSLRNGEQHQAAVLDWQIRSTFAAGCAGAFVFSWTDEWFRGGQEVEGWGFGLTSRTRDPKPALAAATAALAEASGASPDLPFASVVVCTYNGARTLRDCLDGLAALDYPAYEVIVVDDGSSDGSAAIAAEHGCRLISTANRGLSNARNTGMEAARGEFVAYLDDDARPLPGWLRHLADEFARTSHAAIGGPNIPFPDAEGVAQCVARAPGGPVHVLTSDREAEHVPGCNLAVRRAALLDLRGFDPRFVSAGDDVDLCWRLQREGWTIGFSHGAAVLHHRRDSVRRYWRQQWGYGKAEALLERKWPERYNAGGHVTWAGRIYADGRRGGLARRGRVFHGTWGTAPFQSLYERGRAGSLPLMPEWYLAILALTGLLVLGAVWRPLLWSLVLLVPALAAPLAVAGHEAARSVFPARSRTARWRLRALTTLLYLLQPAARLGGRLSAGLAPWSRRGAVGTALPVPRQRSEWSEVWAAPESRLTALEGRLRDAGAAVGRGGDFDRWDLLVRGGLLGAARLRLAVEEHGSGRQLVRVRVWPVVSLAGVAVAALLAGLAAAAGVAGHTAVCALLAACAAGLAAGALHAAGGALATVLRQLPGREA
jgi:O-antigen biosynthesis protein